MISKETKDISIGIIGTGFIAEGLFNLIISKNELKISNMLTRTNIKKRNTSFQKYLTTSISELIENSDIIIECTGEVLYAVENISEIMKHDIPIITMNTEFHVTVGTYFVDKCFITEAEGDQPGCFAALNKEMLQMGFNPLVYGNIKGFLNKNPSLDDMKYWAKKSNLSLNMVTSFTDGTKVQMEQAFVANGLNATILQKGMLGKETSDFMLSAEEIASQASELGQKVCEYVVSPSGPAGVFITGTHDKEQIDSLRYYKLGNGPYYTLVKPYHLPHLEIYKTILNTIRGGEVLLNNGPSPTISVAAIAKKDITKGTRIDKAIGSFLFRGEAIRIKDYKNHIPIGLLSNAVTKKDIKEGELVMLEDFDIETNLALDIWHKILEKAL